MPTQHIAFFKMDSPPESAQRIADNVKFNYLYMNAIKKLTLFAATLAVTTFSVFAQDAKWIAPNSDSVDTPNRWGAFRKDFYVETLPSAKAKIAVDSKYWLWINGQLAVFEGGLKRGPTPNSTFFDEVDISPYLKRGKNTLAMLVWHFGKDGMSHKSSGKFGMIFDLDDRHLKLKSDASWLSRIHPAYEVASFPFPNHRLPESHVRFNAQNDMPNWQTCAKPTEEFAFAPSRELGKWGDTPWGDLQPRSIPLFRDFGIHDALAPQSTDETPPDDVYRTVTTARLPYNMQITPVITIDDPVGNNFVEIQTDHSYTAERVCLRAEYITKKGRQTYESLGWLNGEKIKITTPKGLKIEKIQYRQTGYDTDISGKFACSDAFFNTFWLKAMRTLHLNMRDTFMDCPDRERGQYSGDAVVQMGQCFYYLSPTAHLAVRRAFRDTVNWRKPNGVLHAPVPGDFTMELPGQSLTFFGKFGLWDYYMNSGDLDTLKFAYPHVKKYLGLWKTDSSGLPELRGDWIWGDWGGNVDKRLLIAMLYHTTLECMANAADTIGYPDDAAEFRKRMSRLKCAIDKCWNGKFYIHPEHKEKPDDRVQAFAVLTGIADASKFDAIADYLNRNQFASCYMERFVMEAFFRMGRGTDGIKRVKHRYAEMVNDKTCSTLYEDWNLHRSTTNHSWTGGPITVISRLAAGLEPLAPAWKVFRVEPQPSGFSRMGIEVPSLAGVVKSAFRDTENTFELDLTVPEGSTAVVKLPVKKDAHITVNDSANTSEYESERYADPAKPTFVLTAGVYKIRAAK